MERSSGMHQLQPQEIKPVYHIGIGINQLVQDQVPGADVQQPETDHTHPHNRSGTERNLQPAVQTFAGRLGRTGGSVRRRFHADETAKTGEDAAGQKRDRNKRVLDAHISKDQENQRQYDEYDTHHFILALQICHRAFADILSNLSHQRGSFIRFHHLAVKLYGDQQG